MLPVSISYKCFGMAMAEGGGGWWGGPWKSLILTTLGANDEVGCNNVRLDEESVPLQRMVERFAQLESC